VSRSELLSVRIERRSLGVALFFGTRLDFVQARELPSDHASARRTVQSFLTWAMETFRPACVAIEKPQAPSGTRRSVLERLVLEILNNLGLSPVQVERGKVIGALSPSIRTRREAREAVCRLWPALSSGAAADAVALGLHLQVSAVLHQ
jgi:hypothetical protein